jgi:hypothetical protein
MALEYNEYVFVFVYLAISFISIIVSLFFFSFSYNTLMTTPTWVTTPIRSSSPSNSIQTLPNLELTEYSLEKPVLRRYKALCGCGNDCNNILEHFPGKKCNCYNTPGGCVNSLRGGCNCGCGKI